ncbi:unnamed protein product [Boreogadus saida]
MQALRFAGPVLPFVMLHGRYVPLSPSHNKSPVTELSSGNAARPRASLEAGQLALEPLLSKHCSGNRARAHSDSGLLNNIPPDRGFRVPLRQRLSGRRQPRFKVPDSPAVLLVRLCQHTRNRQDDHRADMKDLDDRRPSIVQLVWVFFAQRRVEI